MIFDGLAPDYPYLLNDEVPFNSFPYLSSLQTGILHYIVEPGDCSLNYYSEFISYEDPVISSSQYTSLEFAPFETTVVVNFDIDLSSHFVLENDIIIHVIEEDGNIVDGKTHLDSVCEGVVKAILAALESFVKAVKELASKVFNWIYSLVNKIFEPIFKQIRDLIKSFVDFIIDICTSFTSDKIPTSITNIGGNPIWTVFILLDVVGLALSLIALPFTGIISILISILVGLVSDLIIQALIGAVSSVTMSGDALSLTGFLKLIGIDPDTPLSQPSSGRITDEQSFVTVLDLVEFIVGVMIILHFLFGPGAPAGLEQIGSVKSLPTMISIVCIMGGLLVNTVSTFASNTLDPNIALALSIALPLIGIFFAMKDISKFDKLLAKVLSERKSANHELSKYRSIQKNGFKGWRFATVMKKISENKEKLKVYGKKFITWLVWQERAAWVALFLNVGLFMGTIVTLVT